MYIMLTGSDAWGTVWYSYWISPAIFVCAAVNLLQVSIAYITLGTSGSLVCYNINSKWAIAS